MAGKTHLDTSLQSIFLTLQQFWADQGCVILQPYDKEMGAATFHPATSLYTLGPRHLKAAFVQPCRRPQDGRYGDNPNRFQKFFQFQVILKPAPHHIQDILLDSFTALGLDIRNHDIRFVEDDWAGPTLGATGVGWEVWFDGMEVVQFTYFQQMGAMACEVISAELAYGLERIALCVQRKDCAFDLQWNPPGQDSSYSYKDLCLQEEREFSQYYFEEADVPGVMHQFEQALRAGHALLKKDLVLPAYEYCMGSSHLFNILNARGCVSGAERVRFIQKIRALAAACCHAFLEKEKKEAPHA